MQVSHLIAKYAICYAIFFLITYFSKIQDGNKLFNSKGPVTNPAVLTGLQLAGILWLGIIPANIFPQHFLTVLFGKNFPGILQLCFLLMLIINVALLAGIQAEKRCNQITKEGTNFNLPPANFFLRYFIIRITFLAAYETWFRGYLLTDCVNQLGYTLAIAINVLLYAFLHLFSGKNEFWGSIPLGLLLCSICIWFGAAWPAIVIHIILAITYESALTRNFLNSKKVLA